MTGKELQDFRSSLGLNQVDFAKKFNITTQTIYRWEQEHTKIPTLISSYFKLYKKLIEIKSLIE